jgi:hypothetical protein
MDPVGSIQELLKVDKRSAKVLLAGIGVVAATAITSAWVEDVQTALLTGTAIVIAGAFLKFVAAIDPDPLLKRVIAWLVTIVFFVVLIAGVLKTIFPSIPAVAPLSCLVRPWQTCDAVQDAVADRNAPTASVVRGGLTTAAVADPASKASKVFIKFAGYQRESIIDLASALVSSGWDVNNSARGGERTEAAYRKAVVTYRTAGDATAAEDLARAIEATGLKADIQTSMDPQVPEETLQLWISL